MTEPGGATLRFSPQSLRDLRRLKRGPRSDAILSAIHSSLGSLPPAANADIKAMAGRTPWLRLRVGVHRVLFRRLTAAEADEFGDGYFVARVVHRSQLDEAVAMLQ